MIPELDDLINMKICIKMLKIQEVNLLTIYKQIHML